MDQFWQACGVAATPRLCAARLPTLTDRKSPLRLPLLASDPVAPPASGTGGAALAFRAGTGAQPRAAVAGAILAVNRVDEAEFLYLIHHGSRQYWFRLKWLGDILAISERQPNLWQSCQPLAEILGPQNALVQAVTLIQWLWPEQMTAVMQTIRTTRKLRSPSDGLGGPSLSAGPRLSGAQG